jgi:hypothetical protein
VSRGIWLVVLAVACSCGIGSGPPLDAFPGIDDNTLDGDCALALFGSSPDGQCVARWNCKTDGLHTLSCGGLDSGVACVCLIQSMPPKNVSMLPANCTDAAVLVTFAREECGWVGL